MPATQKKPKRTKRFIPDLNRYHRFSSSKKIYVPFDCPEDLRKEYQNCFRDPEHIIHSACVALSRMFGFPAELISEKLKEKMLEAASGAIRCSSLRAVLEGRVPGLPKPTSHVPHRNQIARTTLVLADIMDTLVCEYLQEIDGGLTLFDGEGDAFQDEETGSGNGDRVQEPGEIQDQDPPEGGV